MEHVYISWSSDIHPSLHALTPHPVIHPSLHALTPPSSHSPFSPRTHPPSSHLHPSPNTYFYLSHFTSTHFCCRHKILEFSQLWLLCIYMHFQLKIRRAEVCWFQTYMIVHYFSSFLNHFTFFIVIKSRPIFLECLLEPFCRKYLDHHKITAKVICYKRVMTTMSTTLYHCFFCLSDPTPGRSSNTPANHPNDTIDSRQHASVADRHAVRICRKSDDTE